MNCVFCVFITLTNLETNHIRMNASTLQIFKLVIQVNYYGLPSSWNLSSATEKKLTWNKKDDNSLNNRVNKDKKQIELGLNNKIKLQ